MRFQKFVGHLTEFQAAAAVITAAPAARQKAMARDLLDSYPLSRPQSPAIILELLRIARDYLGFGSALELIGRLPQIWPGFLLSWSWKRSPWESAVASRNPSPSLSS
jgi:hypothetical protein